MAVAQISKSSCIELRNNPGFYLRSDAAKAWDRATVAFGKVVLISGAWRSYETQEHLFDGEKYPNQDPQYGRYLRGNRAGQSGYTNDVRWWPAKSSYWTRKASSAAAAVPGTSNHGGGVAVDVKTSRQGGDPGYDVSVIFGSWTDIDRTRFLQVAAEHGWDDDEGRIVSEHWHLTYYPDRDQHRGEPVPPPLNEEFLMALSETKQDKIYTETTGPIPDGDRTLDGPREGIRVSIELLRRIERDNGAERERERLRAAAERERDIEQRAHIAALTTTVQTMAANQGMSAEQMVAAVHEAIGNITITVAAS